MLCASAEICGSLFFLNLEKVYLEELTAVFQSTVIYTTQELFKPGRGNKSKQKAAPKPIVLIRLKSPFPFNSGGKQMAST